MSGERSLTHIVVLDHNLDALLPAIVLLLYFCMLPSGVINK
jgi:hypothetical protein